MPTKKHQNLGMENCISLTEPMWQMRKKLLYIDDCGDDALTHSYGSLLFYRSTKCTRGQQHILV